MKAKPSMRVFFLQDYQTEATSMRRILFLSKVSPPRVLAAITLRKNFDDLEFEAFGNCYKHNQATVAVTFPKADPLTANKWVKITMVYGATNRYGKKGIRIMQGAQSAFEYMSELSWCETDDDFIQAIQLPGGIIMSPVEVTLSPLPLKVLQDRFYHQKEKMDVRTGPRVVDKKRKYRKIPYSRSEFTYPVALIAPPVIFQKRKIETPNCSSVAGTDYNYVLWNSTTNGETCDFPYECGEKLMSDPTELLRCKSDETPTKFFGAKKIGKAHPGHTGWFFEFLQTVAAAHILKRVDQRRRFDAGDGRRTAGRQSIWDTSRRPFVYSPVLEAQSFDRPGSRRASSGVAQTAGGGSTGAGSKENGNPQALPALPTVQGKSVEGGKATDIQEGAVVFDPGRYLDFQTEKVQILIPTFSSQFGIASIIKIEADVTSEVTVDFSVKHYQSAEGQRLADFQIVCFAIIAVAFVILFEKCIVLSYKTPEERRQGAGLFALDFVLQVALPLVYVSMRMKSLSGSSDHLDHTVGPHGLAGITLLSLSASCEDEEQNRRVVKLFKPGITGARTCNLPSSVSQEHTISCPRQHV